jgi:hypothetical protein
MESNLGGEKQRRRHKMGAGYFDVEGKNPEFSSSVPCIIQISIEFIQEVYKFTMLWDWKYALLNFLYH